MEAVAATRVSETREKILDLERSFEVLRGHL